MTPSDLQHLLACAERAATRGGAVVLEHFGRARDVRAKAPGDWVSAADTGSEEAVKASLARDVPDLPFFGEEGGGVRGRTGWFVDPLDGTANFLHGFDAVGVSVALVDDGVPVVGVVHAPLLARTFTAVRGGGAHRDGVPLAVGSRAPEQAIVATGFPFRRKDLLAGYLEMFGACLATFEDCRRVGAASLDLAWTAEGVFDGFFEKRLGTWDVAAGALLIREAGGVVTDWDGDEHRWLETGDILAGPPAVHERLVALAAAHASAF